MNKHAIYHRSKSEYAYAYNKDTLHLLLRTAKDDFDRVDIVIGDPFQWKNQAWVHEIFTMKKRYQSELFDYYFIEYKSKYLRTKYTFILYKNDDVYIYGTRGIEKIHKDEHERIYNLSQYFNYPYINHEDLHNTPSWVKDTVWYQIFPDRFNSVDNQSTLNWNNKVVKNNEIYGGNLQGVIEKIPHLKELGVTGIYFTPIFKSPSAHKYDTSDYFTIDPTFGTNEDFKELVQKCHENNIKVVLDAVFNHAGYDHPFFQDVIKNGEKSIYKNSFFIEKFPVVNFPLDEFGKPKTFDKTNLNYRTFAFTPFMPKWNTSDPLAEKHLLDVTTYWIKEYDIDGWRVDVSNEISHDFLRKMRVAAKTAKQDTFLFGENWDSSLPWLQGDQMDSVMNYDWVYPVWQYFEHKITLEQFKSQMNDYLAQTPKHVLINMFNMLDSHDTMRIKHRLNEDMRRVMLAFVFMFVSCGAPNIYYGTEIGMTGAHDPDNRRTFPKDKTTYDMDFFNFLKKLIQIREYHPSLKTPDYLFTNSNVLSFYKELNDERVLVLINNTLDTVEVNTTSMKGTYINLFTEEKVIINDILKMNSYDFLLLKEVTYEADN